MPIRWRCGGTGAYHRKKLHPCDWAWLFESINGIQRRLALKTQSEREANRLFQEKLKELTAMVPDPSKAGRKFKKMTIAEAIESYIEERKTDVSQGQIKSWRTTAGSLADFFKDARLDQITSAGITAYKNRRVGMPKQNGSGVVAPKSVNNELSTLRVLLKRADQWFRIRDNFKLAKIRTWREGRALTDEQQLRLFQVAQSQEKYRYAYVLLVLGYYCGMRPCESLNLRWCDIILDPKRPSLSIKRSKTQAGYRYPSLNSICLEALTALYEKARECGMADPDHFVFPYHPRGRFRKNKPPVDPTRPMTKYARQWNAIRKEAGLQGFWFYDGRHTARTKMAEMGLPDEVMDAQMGHVSKDVGKKYSHIRREALKRAAAALEPSDAIRKILMITPEADKNATVQ